MKLIHLALCLALIQPSFLHPAFASASTQRKSIHKVSEQTFRSLRHLRSSWRHSPTLEQFLQKSEDHLKLSPKESFRPFLTSKNEKQWVNFTLFGNKVNLESHGRTVVIELTDNHTLSINGQKLSDSDFRSQKALLSKIQSLIEPKNPVKNVSLFLLLLDTMLPSAHADMGWIGFSAIVIAAGLVSFGIYKATKNLSNTKHEVEVKTPPEITLNHKVDVPEKISTEHTVNVNAAVEATGNVNAQGLPEEINLNIEVPGVR